VGVNVCVCELVHVCMGCVCAGGLRLSCLPIRLLLIPQSYTHNSHDTSIPSIYPNIYISCVSMGI